MGAPCGWALAAIGGDRVAAVVAAEPFGYPGMIFLAMFPPLWRRRMNPRVRAWRRQFYPDIEDWGPYNRGELPMPRGAL